MVYTKLNDFETALKYFSRAQVYDEQIKSIYNRAHTSNQLGEAYAIMGKPHEAIKFFITCLLYTSDAADERSSVDLGGRRIIKKKKKE